MRARNAAKAVIVQDRRLLVLKYLDPADENAEEYYGLPGGGQEHGETLEQALYRECQEEINVDIEMKELLFVREYIGKNHLYITHSHIHQIDFLFLCTIQKGEPATGHTPDTQQVGVEWLPLDQLENTRFFPSTLRGLLARVLSEEAIPAHPVYVGDVD